MCLYVILTDALYWLQNTIIRTSGSYQFSCGQQYRWTIDSPWIDAVFFKLPQIPANKIWVQTPKMQLADLLWSVFFYVVVKLCELTDDYTLYLWAPFTVFINSEGNYLIILPFEMRTIYLKLAVVILVCIQKRRFIILYGSSFS